MSGFTITRVHILTDSIHAVMIEIVAVRSPTCYISKHRQQAWDKRESRNGAEMVHNCAECIGMVLTNMRWGYIGTLTPITAESGRSQG